MTAGLGLTGLVIVETLEEEFQTTFTLKVENPKPQAHECLFAALSVKNGTKEQYFRDLNRNGKWVGINVLRQRFRCRHCGTITYTDIPHMAEGRMMTERLARFIWRAAATRTFADLGRELRLSEGTVKNVWMVDATEKMDAYVPEAPRVLGIDEKKLMGDYRCVLGNVEKRTMLDLLASRRKASLHDYFGKMPNRHRVEIVCMDMWPPYREAAREFFPKAEIIADKFHVMKLAGDAMDAVRKDVRSTLERAPRLRMMRARFTLYKRRSSWGDKDHERFEYWETAYPELVEAYRIKEEFCDIFDTASSRAEAQHRYFDWVRNIPASYIKAFHPVTRAMNNWGGAAFAYFEHRYTSAYVESLNRLLGDIQRAGHGYSFEVLRAKALLVHAIAQEERPKFQRRRTQGRSDAGMGFMLMADTNSAMHKVPPTYGIPISTLDALSQHGWFNQ